MTQIIVANWKMNKVLDESVSYVKELLMLIKGIRDKEVVICPPFTLLYPLHSILRNSVIKLGSQDVFYENSGAFTGEISPLMLKDIGCEYVLIGHSERRQYFNESDDDVNKKLKAVLDYRLKPIMCIGERLSERKSGRAFEVIETQLSRGLANLGNEIIQMSIAYEPIWAIGTGVNATPTQAQEMHSFIRRFITKRYPNLTEVKILYGGSVTPENSNLLLKERDVNGLLVGTASLEPKKFAKILMG